MSDSAANENVKPKRPSIPKAKSQTATLGPVSNLESYVKADWWRHLFNANYLRTDGDVVGDADITAREVDLFLDVIRPQPRGAILDLCCGQGRHVLEFARRGFSNVCGLDRSHYLIRRARSVRKTEGLTANFREGDARHLPFASDTFDHVLIAGNSFGYFETSADDLCVLDEVQRVLKNGGTLMIDITDGDHMRASFDPRSWEWIDRNYFVCRERSLSSDGDRLISREVITHTRKGVVADQFYAERLYSPETIRGLLTTAGFSDVEVRGQITGDSTRNQDLGMMGQRLLITTRIEKQPAMVVRQAVRRVTVVMGDPTLGDEIKPDGTFNEDDHFTISKLKDELGSLGGYEISYLNSHASLIGDLTSLRGNCDLVFNLCDEGFENDPTRELHVAALLEMIGIPYTGGTPQCLAYCYDKSLVRGIASEMGLPVPNAFMVKPGDSAFVDLGLPFPVIVKPNCGDSSFGITAENVCHNLQQLEAAILRTHEKLGYDRPVLVEELLTGKDITVGIIGNPPGDYIALPIIEEDYSCLPDGLPHICGYEAKWDPTSPYWQIKSRPAELPEATEQFLHASCIQLFERLGCRDYARFDWRLDANGTPRLLEANPNPGWCWDGHLAKAAAQDDTSYGRMLEMILNAATRRTA